MEKYKKPKCDCGSSLQGRRNETWIVTRSITKDGELSDNVIGKRTLMDDCDYEIKLCCPKCGNTYEVDYDNHDRIIRGELNQ